MLAVVLQINRVAEQLRGIARNGGEWANADTIGAVDMVVFNDSGIGTEQKLRAALGLVGEVARMGTGGEAGDPVAAADAGLLAQLDGIQIHGHR